MNNVDVWRVLDLEINDCATNMAIDEAILFHISEGKVPNTIRTYRWNPSAVSIGYFQSVYEEVNIEACQSKSVDVVRRITGGGAVYHDYEGEITYSVLVRDNDPKIPKDIIKSYQLICQGIIYALADIGIDATFKPINDIIAGTKKISGNAQTRRKPGKDIVMLQHGTILRDLDIKKMFSVLRVSKEKISDKLIEQVEQRVTSIRRELGDKLVDFETLKNSLERGFSKTLSIQLERSTLTESERKLATEFKEKKYGAKDWVFKR